LAELKFLGYLAEIAGAREKILVLDKPMLLRKVLPSSFPEKNVIILIDKKVGSLDSLIENGNSIVIMPILSGG
jgi:molybdopterin converting factor small subunit